MKLKILEAHGGKKMQWPIVAVSKAPGTNAETQTHVELWHVELEALE